LYINAILHDFTKKGIFHPRFYGNVINRAKTFNSDTSKIVKYLKDLIRKDYDLATMVHSLKQVDFVFL